MNERHRLEAEAIEALARNPSITDLDAVALPILLGSTDRDAVVRLLAHARSRDARMWVVFVIDDGHVTGAGDVLSKLVGDRDGDIRSEALRVLIKVDPTAARDLVPLLIKRLMSTDYYEPVGAMWALATIGATSAIAAIRAAAERWESRDWHHRVADVVLDYLEGRHGDILDRIRRHDHVAMPWLTRAAAMMHSDEAKATLTWAETAFADDLSCMNAARAALGKDYVGSV